ncbi:hypothetical protein ABNN70_04785 [Sporolactobacillus sp. Y61]|uniref:Uncharacterized protein n=1 Tax=Sporolactobacillus sp. Y61 TaxID=3160863 RepID=A0AAU8IHS4_9BACL
MKEKKPIAPKKYSSLTSDFSGVILTLQNFLKILSKEVIPMLFPFDDRELNILIITQGPGNH